jgi:hypothetical protein
MRSVTLYHIMVERQDKAPFDARESTRTTGNGVNLRDLIVGISRLRTRNLARYRIRRDARADGCRNDGVSIGRGPSARPGATRRPERKPRSG